MTKMFYDQVPAVRETTLKIYLCPSRERSKPLYSVVDVQQATSNPPVSGGVADYATNTGTPPGQTDYWPGMNGVTELDRANGPFWYKGPPTLRFSNVSDGLSNVVFIGEKHVRRPATNTDSSVWNGDHGGSFKKLGTGAPIARDLNATTGQFGSWHPSVCQFVFGDGSVKALQVSTDLTTLDRIANRDDGEPVTLP
jgi:hypothetical protein